MIDRCSHRVFGSIHNGGALSWASAPYRITHGQVAHLLFCAVFVVALPRATER